MTGALNTSPEMLRKVRRIVWAHYKKHGRHDLPWRATANPYHILVSEVMLQQTQVVRVVPKYVDFIQRYPTVRSLARASLREVLVCWQGLGYNRRARALHTCAQAMVKTHKGKVPSEYHTLLALPGIGPYTASAVCVFAFEEARPLIETNIRTVLLHHFLPTRGSVHDRELYVLAESLMETTHPREWHYALMDYGAFLKQSGTRLNARSKHYRPQSKFSGSDREVRGAIVRELTRHPTLATSALFRLLSFERERATRILATLINEGLVVKRRGTLALPQ